MGRERSLESTCVERADGKRSQKQYLKGRRRIQKKNEIIKRREQSFERESSDYIQ